ncbi:malto-oligosyltrehalose synthase [Nitrospira moscoviensis]|uniref:Malto-oligosyltrehalose synthase n=1 Tax=Nitrospira moscoviensis TaxID=42253 RepID=A0A0K2GEB7_NITMO|nr:malto-oligosyltrehalose synthase [Nitrospira moscoviensis]ALA59209.1 Malto-oligosyltrehalose synthase [Nitrospira moscoviensis]
MPPPRIPIATYRLQFNGGFTFADATAIVPYLHDLGITHCYASSLLTAMPGSTHGYDIIDPTALNPEIGTEAEFRRFVDALHERDMGVVLDVVPNHMGIGKALNRWWRDVLENGPSSRYAEAFDIDWHPIKRELDDKVLLPILADQYGAVLEDQEIAVVYEDGQFLLRYGEHELPVAPKSWIRILSHRLDTLVGTEEDAAQADVMELQSILTAIRNLPGREERDPERIAERYREKEIIKKRLAALMEGSGKIRDLVLENVRRFNGERGRSESFDLLDALLNEQAYRLASWKVASEEINYRRFFDINDLAAVRMENPDVFRESHQLVFQLIREGAVNGLRIDHVDGLYDPGRYLGQLQAWAERELERAGEERPLFLVVEKILGRDEALPETWPVHGTTGYDFIHVVNNLFVQSANERAFTELYHRVIGREESYADLVYASKRLIMRVSMSSEINVLGHQLNVISERDRRSRDFTLNSLTHAIREIIACFPVYRTYATDGPEPVADRDRAYIHMAVARAKRRNPALSGQVFDFIRAILLKQSDARTPRDREEQIRFVMKFQQTTSPVTAKGIEDTVFYRYNRLVSLNEVGGEPEQFGLSVDEFHKRMRERQARWPHALSASTTHDTKRSEDVRARLAVLSEMPQEWKAHVARWRRLNRKHRGDAEGERQPDRNDEYLFYQTLVGAWPLHAMGEEAYRTFCERIQRYMEKAIHEAKVHTSWVNPSHGYDAAMREFVRAVLDRSASQAFFDDFLPFQERIAHYGLFTGLSQLLLKVTAPGIPDFYQGTELWDLSLVDPDNRRPVEYGVRTALAGELAPLLSDAAPGRSEEVRALAQHPRDGRLKWYVAAAGLHYRRRRAALFQQGEYLPLESGGSRKQHVCAFARVLDDQAVVTVVPRLLATLTADVKNPPVGAGLWEDSWVAVPPWPTLGSYRHVLTGDILTVESVSGRRVLPLARVFQDCPLALLERIS